MIFKKHLSGKEASFIISFFCQKNHYILVRVIMDQEPIRGTLGAMQAYPKTGRTWRKPKQTREEHAQKLVTVTLAQY